MGEKSRINKFIALSGVCSRRAAEQLILSGAVTVNGEILTDLGRQIDHDLDTVTVRGKKISPVKESIYILLYKPTLTVTTASDPQGRRTVIDLLHEGPKRLPHDVRVYPVGRLDYDTEGALLLTNDGELAHRLAHPRYQVEKVYHALVDGQFTATHAEKIRAGIALEDGHIGKAESILVSRNGANSLVELKLTEGHKREVRQLLAGCGLNTLSLKRVSFAGITCDDLKPGQWRRLTDAELKFLRKLVS